ncbi:MAG TPA: hypothetical protein GXZ67_04925 [Clostridiaceae bacterium]|nr:hypothetical protein [Clostridiaceae bacterium]
MAAFEWIINVARDQAIREDVFDYEAFEEYREISDADLPVDSFFVDEMHTVNYSRRTQNITIAFVILFVILFFILTISLGLESQSSKLACYLVGLPFIIIGGILMALQYRTEKAFDNTSQSFQGLQRGVVLNITTVTNNVLSSHLGRHRWGKNERVASFTFCTVFFPDNGTYIKHVFFTRSLGWSQCRFGEKVVVSKYDGESEARMSPTIHLEVPESLIERAKAVREARGISDQVQG